ncbi:glycoside hydrolase family 25 protein [Biostraticola tofi]|uniref:Lysozyme n=1 Tax=Biostraticola tofi TaxID=466109 RepID=A0A4R3YQX0_9GAMM|nr:GH25 family lysozyme [Biostraticola tofi]TCV95217.1 lysozyme [Biostraticola tofi]
MNNSIIAISSHQGSIEWNTVFNKGGVSHAFSRLGEGADFLDHSFDGNFKSSKDAGLKAGAWHIFRARSSTPNQQAKTIIEKLKGVGFTSEDSFVFEVYNKRGDNKDASREEMANNLHALITIINSSELPISNRQLYIKTNIDTWKNSLAWDKHPDTFRRCNLWVEQWQDSSGKPDQPQPLQPWSEGKWTFWEYSQKGRVDGIKTDVLISKANEHSSS